MNFTKKHCYYCYKKEKSNKIKQQTCIECKSTFEGQDWKSKCDDCYNRYTNIVYYDKKKKYRQNYY